MSDTQRPKAVGDKLAADEINKDLPVPLTAGEAIASTPLAVYIKEADGLCYKTTATPVGENATSFIGFTADIATGSGSPISVQMKGLVSGFTGLATGSEYFLQDVAGTIGTPQGGLVKFIGYAVSTTQILLVKEKRFGKWVSHSLDDVVLAETDGFVVVYATATGTGDIDGFTDGSNPPTTKRVSMKLSVSYISISSFTMLVKKGDYWEVNDDADEMPGSVAVYWMPFA